MDFIEAKQRAAWHAFRYENDHDAAPEVLARINTELDAQEDARQRFRREQMATKFARTDTTFSPGLFAGSKDSTWDSAARESAGAFWTWVRYGFEDGRGDPLRTYDAEVKWADARRRTGLDLEKKALISADDTSGGFLAPPEYAAELIKAIVLASPMRDLVRVRKTVNRSVQQPKRTGTAAAVWVSESQTRSETQNPAFGGVEVPCHELTAEVYISFQDLEDSAFDLEAELTNEFAEQFAVSEGAAVVGGNGVGKPFGFTDPGQGIATTNSGTSGSIAGAAGAQGDPLINLCHAVKTPYAKNATWVLNRQTLGSVRKLKDTQGQYLWAPAIGVGMPNTILGYPYTEVPDLANEAANSLSVGFGDWKRAYTIADRISLSLVRDPYSRASSGQVKFLARRRVGGQVVLAEAVRLLRCAV